MSRRLLAAVAFVACGLWAQPAVAQDRPLALSPVMSPAAGVANTATAPSVPDAAPLQLPARPFDGTRRSSLLTSLYASTAITQALDVHSTLSAMKRGGVEGNPMMSGVASHPGALIATKAAVAFGTIFAARQIARHNKVAAIAALVGINSAYAMIISHNYGVARAGR
jgi:hypothetical protein